MSNTTLSAVEFHPPLVNPSPGGLYSATNWTDEVEPLRWLADGVQVRTHNYGGESAFGVWTADWCAGPDDLAEGDLKTGTRPGDPGPFDPITVWAYDECDLTAPSQTEVKERAAQNLRLMEQVAVEREFAARAKLDAGTPGTAADLVEAVSKIEAAFSKTNTVGLIHASPACAAGLARYGLATRSGTGLRSPSGHLFVLGGGYVEGLGTTLVGTSPTFGWRGPVAVRDTLDLPKNAYVAIAERSVVVGYEKAVAAVKIA